MSASSFPEWSCGRLLERGAPCRARFLHSHGGCSGRGAAGENPDGIETVVAWTQINHQRAERKGGDKGGVITLDGARVKGMLHALNFFFVVVSCKE